MNNKLVIIGNFGRVHGVRGWINLNSFTVPKENIQNLLPWLIFRNGVQEKIVPEAIRPHDKDLIVKLKNCDDRDAAALFTNCKIAVLRQQLPKTKKNEYYWTDLEGLAVINHNNINLGNVSYLYSNGVHDVMVIETKNNQDKKQQHFIPFIKNVINQVDLDAQTIYVNWE